MNLFLRTDFTPNGGVYVLDKSDCKAKLEGDDYVLTVPHKGDSNCGVISAEEVGVGLFHHIILL